MDLVSLFNRQILQDLMPQSDPQFGFEDVCLYFHAWSEWLVPFPVLEHSETVETTCWRLIWFDQPIFNQIDGGDADGIDDIQNYYDKW